MATLMSLQMESIHGLTLTSRLHLHDCARLFYLVVNIICLIQQTFLPLSHN